MTRRLPRILRRPPNRIASEESNDLSDYPIAFVAAIDATPVGEYATVPRSVLGRMLLEARELQLCCLPTIGLHGVSRLDRSTPRRLLSDLEVIQSTSRDGAVREAAEQLILMAKRVRDDARLTLLVAAGK